MGAKDGHPGSHIRLTRLDFVWYCRAPVLVLPPPPCHLYAFFSAILSPFRVNVNTRGTSEGDESARRKQAELFGDAGVFLFLPPTGLPAGPPVPPGFFQGNPPHRKRMDTPERAEQTQPISPDPPPRLLTIPLRPPSAIVFFLPTGANRRPSCQLNGGAELFKGAGSSWVFSLDIQDLWVTSPRALFFRVDPTAGRQMRTPGIKPGV